MLWGHSTLQKKDIILLVHICCSVDSHFFLQKLQKLGAEIYIDDFGSGYANFDYLLKLNPNGVKIDGSLIKDILDNKNRFTLSAYKKRKEGYKQLHYKQMVE